MAEPPLSVLLPDADDDLHRRLLAAGLRVASIGDAEGDGGGARQPDAIVVQAASAEALAALGQRADLPQMAFDSAVVLLVGVADDALVDALIVRGVEAVVAETDRDRLPQAIRHAVLRKRVERASRTAYATDLATGLPHQAQLLEHMTQLFALREREPAQMVLLVLRIDGYAAAAARLGSEAANILRRKVAVRLRGGLRASDVVAAIGPDAFGVLLGRLESPGDGERVAAKLVQSLERPLLIAGQACPVLAAVGMALYPAHGRDARALLQRASAQAGSVAVLGAEGFGAQVGSAPGVSANDERA